MTQHTSPAIKIKLLLALLISLTAIGLAGYYAYGSFKSLLASVNTLSKPTHSVTILQNVMNNMLDADATMRNYLLTPEDSVLQQYLDGMEAIQYNLNDLRKLSTFQQSPESIDSLTYLFQDKADLMYELATLKKSPDYQNPASKAMSQISSNLSNDDVTLEPIIIDESAPAIKPQADPHSTITNDKIKKKNDGKKKGGWFAKKDKDEQIQPQLPVVKIEDTSSMKNSVTDVTLDYALATSPALDVSDVRKVLKEVNDEQLNYNRQVTTSEKKIIERDKIIMQSIKDIIQRVQYDEEQTIQAQLSGAKEKARTSSEIILLISIGALLTGLIFFAFILADINRSNKYKLQLEESRHQAEQLAIAKEEFLATMSHEIRTPLNAVIGFSEQLAQTPLQSSQKNYLKAVQNAGTHLLNTVNDILNLSKIEAGKLVLEKNPFILKDVIEEIASILSIKAQEKNLVLEYATDGLCESYVLGDAFRIKQILYNLVGNAIKFTETGTVKINCRGKQHPHEIEYQIEIADTGIGIPRDKLHAIFENFIQANLIGGRKYEGTGLGLSIAKKLTELMNGEIYVSSKEQIGSVFTVYIRLQPAPAKSIDEIKRYNSPEPASLKGIE